MHQQQQLSGANAVNPAVAMQQYLPMGDPQQQQQPKQTPAEQQVSPLLAAPQPLASPMSTNHVPQYSPETNAKYKLKYKRLRKVVKQVMFLNAALCDEVVKAEERVIRSREERRFLLKKLFQYQTLSDATSRVGGGHSRAKPPSISPIFNSGPSSVTPQGMLGSDTPKVKVKKEVKKKEVNSTEVTKGKSKKPKPPAPKLIQPIPSDSSGRPIFPIELGTLTVYSIGEVVCDRAGYHSNDYIYPVGFCTTRLYASLDDPLKQCIYTCKITDNGPKPKFEICPDDNPSVVFASDSASECHRMLLERIRRISGVDLVEAKGKGPDFFGFSHPTIQNLIQNCPGVKKCISYHWVKFELCKMLPESGELTVPSENDASISFEALKKSPMFRQLVSQREQHEGAESSAHLRSLLSKH
ncbi:transforming growth factor beta regulator 1 [Lingula anatina]|uniref:Transforming growth factor beta regulator 1 n=1 Tax=Lingula anatina TaxID=7574 RepID=A0A1S3JYP7_LINAN|nr:transforming growth factor beta regulator 1 [Lingula anatina]|eukprot:XP_013415518.1 transforming growth factor beta regulator 1 [Lingula anatina]